MGLRAVSGQASFKGVWLVRNKEGQVTYSDPHNVPQAIIDVLTEDDLKHLELLREQTPLTTE
jgi:hypothetical protein